MQINSSLASTMTYTISNVKGPLKLATQCNCVWSVTLATFFVIHTLLVDHTRSNYRGFQVGCLRMTTNNQNMLMYYCNSTGIRYRCVDNQPENLCMKKNYIVGILRTVTTHHVSNTRHTYMWTPNV